MSGLSRPSFLRICSTASLVAAGPAKYAAGSPGSARVRRNVTITTPIRLGIANISRLPIMVSMVAHSRFEFRVSQREPLSSLPPKGGGNERARLLAPTKERATQADSSRPPITPLRLHQRAVIEAAVEPVLIARDVLLHRDVDEGLIQRNAWDIAEGQVDKSLH